MLPYIATIQTATLLVCMFVLQHGARVLLADEMGLGKTLRQLLWQHAFRTHGLF